MKNLSSFLFALLLSVRLLGQQDPIDVADLTIQIGGLGNQELYYGFAQGDQIVFSFEEIKGKELKEIEIVELPQNSKFMDFKSSGLEHKTLTVHQNAVYLFKFKNSALSARVCKIKIQRIPKTADLISFNTNWEWKTLYDTTYIPYTQDSLIGYDTTYVTKTEKILASTDTLVTELFNKNERVHSETAIGKVPYSYLNVSLPNNTYNPNRYDPMESTEVISWSYWIGVGEESIKEYENANKSLKEGISTIGSLTGYGALASLAVSGISIIESPSIGDNVQYQFMTNQNGSTRVFDSGNGVSASGRNTDLLQGQFTIQLVNDNIKDGIDVSVKLVCLQVKKTWKISEYTEPVIEPKYIQLKKIRQEVRTNKIRVNAN